MSERPQITLYLDELSAEMMEKVRACHDGLIEIRAEVLVESETGRSKIECVPVYESEGHFDLRIMSLEHDYVRAPCRPMMGTAVE